MIINGVIFNTDLMDIIQELKAQLEINGIHMFAKMFDSGDDVMVCCPYHKDGQERKPSAGIRKTDGTFHCFACGETHSLPDVVSYCFGWNDPFGTHGYKWLAKNFSALEVESRDDIEIDLERNNISNKSSVLDNRGNNKSFYLTEEELDSYRYVHPYMYERGLTDNVIELFDIGYDKKTNSITFPVRYWGSMNFGKCMFIAKRRIDYKRFDLPTNIEKPLYGLYELWLDMQIGAFNGGRGRNATIKPASEIYVCEGLFDCLRLWCNGKYAVAGFGCLFSNYQIKLLEGLPTRNLILALDNDEAGRQATNRLKAALPYKLITQVVLPEGRKDIGECTDEELLNMEIEL